MRLRLFPALTSLFTVSAYAAPETNAFMLEQSTSLIGVTNPLNKRGYDWWWHSFVAINRRTGEKQPFFIEYYFINPGLGGNAPILGQDPDNKARGLKPSYAMIKAGTWAEGDARQIHNFYAISETDASSEEMLVRIGPNVATESHLQGAVSLSEDDARNHPEYMSQPGSMSWDLRLEKVLSYSVGYATSPQLRRTNLFQMYWHVQGMKTNYSGTVVYNGDTFDVAPESSYGYQDKNWGQDYTNPWIWLNCNNFVSKRDNARRPDVSFVAGGGLPVVAGIPVGRQLLVAFHYQGQLFEFNFSKPWQRSRTHADVTETSTEMHWRITAENPELKIEVDFANDKSKMLKINYENPNGEFKHRDLWNGGHAHGTVRVFKRSGNKFELVDELLGEYGGAEYGRH